MDRAKQIDCFKINFIFFRFLGIWPEPNKKVWYSIYSILLITISPVVYMLQYVINFVYIPREMDKIIEELLFFFCVLATFSKVITFYFKHEDIKKLLDILEGDKFQSESFEKHKVIDRMKKKFKILWIIQCVASLMSHLPHITVPIIKHILTNSELKLSLCSYSFLSDETKKRFIYPLYFYQILGIDLILWYNVNIDTFFLGLMFLAIAQLDVLKKRLERLTENKGNKTSNILLNEENSIENQENRSNLKEKHFLSLFNKRILHYIELAKYCKLMEDIFSTTLFVQFSVASLIICVCLFRFTLEAVFEYYIFLAFYLFIMTIQVMLPSWFGTRIMHRSVLLSDAAYNCNWTERSKRFKTHLCIFMIRAQKPMAIRGGKMFLLSLGTFTAIIKSAYSFFALLRHVQDI